MKGRVFIAWSGENTLAHDVKNELNQRDYKGVVGGEGGTSTGLFVGHTILNEINYCNQAIFLVQKKNDGYISNNLMFEFGYALARFKLNKIHIFFVDIDDNDEKIPSDLKGIWANYVKSADNDSLAEQIVSIFMASQKHIIPEEKIAVVDDFYTVKGMIQRYAQSPQCSEYELAQYVLFFTQGAYMFNCEEEALGCLRELNRSVHNPGDELSLAVSLSICYMEILGSMQREGDKLYLKRDDYRKFERRLGNMDETSRRWVQDDFTRWFRVIMCDLTNYSHILHASCPNIEPERKERLLKKSLEYADTCIGICEELLSNSANLHFAELFMAYMYRNKATALRLLGEDQEKVSKELVNSYKKREELWDYYSEAKWINSKLLDIFEMEYYLALSEQLEYMDSPVRQRDSWEECEEYINRVKNLNWEKSHYIHRIEKNISPFVG